MIDIMLWTESCPRIMGLYSTWCGVGFMTLRREPVSNSHLSTCILSLNTCIFVFEYFTQFTTQ